MSGSRAVTWSPAPRGLQLPQLTFRLGLEVRAGLPPEVDTKSRLWLLRMDLPELAQIDVQGRHLQGIVAFQYPLERWNRNGRHQGNVVLARRRSSDGVFIVGLLVL